MKSKNFCKKLLKIILIILVVLIQISCCYAAEGSGNDQPTLGTKEITDATNNIQRVITSIAMPLGGVLIFASVVIAALRMITNANNPQKRADSIGSLAWICGGGVILGLSLIIAGIIINVATNNTGSLL